MKLPRTGHHQVGLMVSCNLLPFFLPYQKQIMDIYAMSMYTRYNRVHYIYR